jgi:alkyl sulfatase BDS1-like metallo-beta-lactamase superfamily hydrolase
MTNTALAYKFINDQTLFYINQGLTQNEIAYKLRLPDPLEKVWYTRQYYGTVAHNSKAVYERYMGWYDANPVNLNKLPPEDTAIKTVEYMGGSKAILEKARKDYEEGKYQWVAEVTNHIVFAEPNNQEARDLCADAMEQLAYQAESGTWRNAYLCGAKELRNGSIPFANVGGSTDVRTKMNSELMLDYIGICLDNNAAQDLNFTANLNLTDTGEKYLLTVKSGVLVYQKGIQSPTADATWIMPKEGLFTILSKNKELQKKFVQEGNKELLGQLTDKMVIFNTYFPIIEP